MPAVASARYRSLSACLALCIACPLQAGVSYPGLDEDLKTNVRAFSKLELTACDAPRWRVERLFRLADPDIEKALHALGYYRPTISKKLEWGEDCWNAVFEIDKGEPVRLRNVDIGIHGDAASDKVFLSRLDVPAPKAGQILHHGRYTSYKSSLIRAATYAGFFDADFSAQSVTVDPKAYAADLTLDFESGIKYRFGEISFTEGILEPSLLSRYSDIRPDAPYSAAAVSDLYTALQGSGYFSSVVIRTDNLDNEDKVAPVDVTLVPAKRRVFSAGAGYTTDYGVHARLNYSDRRINTRGHQFESQLYASPVRSELNAAYRWPRRDPRSEWYTVAGGYRHEVTDTSEQDTYKLGVLRTRKLGNSWLETRYLDYEHEEFTIADQTSTSNLLIPGINWGKVIGRELSRSENGYRLNFEIRGASDWLGSDTSFLQLQARAHWIHSFSDKHRLLLRGRLGTTAKDKLAELPASVRFFAGGDRSVRGYGFETLGPVNDDGDVVGGSHLATFGIETDYAFRDQWSVAAFIDTGSAFDSTGPDFSTGVGIGVRWYSPVGPIRLDFAHPLDDPDESLRIHISLGPDL
jgi:translocation and assembly module TamA